MKKSNKYIDISNCQPVDTTITRSGRDTLSLNIVNTAQNGKRVRLSKGLINKLGNPDSVQFLTDDDKLIIASHISDDLETFTFSQSNNGNIYSSGLVTGLTNVFKLNFTNRSSMSFSNIKIKKADIEGAIIKVAQVHINAPDQD